MRISDCSSDVCSSDLVEFVHRRVEKGGLASVDRVAGAAQPCVVERHPQLARFLELVPEGDRIDRSVLLLVGIGVGAFVAQLPRAGFGLAARRDGLDVLDLETVLQIARSEERRVGKECVSTCRTRGLAYL